MCGQRAAPATLLTSIMYPRTTALTLLAVLTAFAAAARATAADTLRSLATRPDGTAVEAPYTDFRKPCYMVSPSADGRRALLFFRYPLSNGQWQPTGEMGLYDFDSRSMLWSRGFDYRLRSVPVGAQGYERRLVSSAGDSRLTSHGVLMTDGRKYTMLDSGDGQTVRWTARIFPVAVVDSLDLMLGYASGSSSKLRAVRLSTGEQLWERKVPHATNWGWDDCQTVNDTMMLVVADDVNFINPLTGSVRVCEARTGYIRTGNMLLKGLVAGLAGGVVCGLTGGAYCGYVPYVNADVMSHTCSNVYRRGQRYYVSDRRRLRCLDASARELWSYEFPPKTVGAAEITGRGDTITMLNYGFALAGGTLMKSCGRPFMASFRADTGEPLGITWLSMDKDMVEGSALTRDGAFLMFNDGLAFQQPADSVVHIRPWNVEAYGEQVDMPNDTLYTFRQNDERLTPLHYDDNRCIVVTAKGKLLVVDRQLQITDDYLARNVYRQRCRVDDVVVVSAEDDRGNSDFWLVHADGRAIAHVDVPVQSMYLQGQTLYVLSGTGLWRLPLNQLKTIEKHEENTVDSQSVADCALR